MVDRDESLLSTAMCGMTLFKKHDCCLKSCSNPLLDHCLAANSFDVFILPLTLYCSQVSNQNFIVFTARRNARNARITSAVLATAIPSVCLSVRPSVRLSVTRRYCVKTTARSTVQFALSDSKMCLVLQKPKNIPQGRPLPQKSWLQVTYPLLKAVAQPEILNGGGQS